MNFILSFSQKSHNIFTKQRSAWLDLLLILGLFAPLYFFLLGNRPFATPDEARYVEIPREMLASHDWLTPRLNGVKYFEKPPLLYWIMALLQKYCGTSEAIMRLPIVCFGLTGIGATYLFGRFIANRAVGLMSAFILGTSVLWLALSRLIILDMAVSVLMTLGLYSLYVGLQTRDNEPRRRLFLALFSIFCALGVLTKGLMVLVVVGGVLFLWVIVCRQHKHLLPLYLPSNTALFLLISIPWHVICSIHNPDFLHKYFIVEHFLRYTTTVHMRYQPFWFFIPMLLVGLLPWTGLLFQGVKSALSSNHPNQQVNRYLFIWFIFVFVFFSFSNSKLIPYILPIFPPLALLLGQWVVYNYKNNSFNKILLPMCVTCGVAACIALCIPAFANALDIPEILTERAEILPYIRYLGCVFLFMAVLSFPMRRAPLSRFIGICGVMFVMSIILMAASPFMQKASLKPLVERALLFKKPQDELISYHTYFQEVPVYAKQIVNVVAYLGELDFGAYAEDTSQWMMTEAQFAQKIEERNTRNPGRTFWLFLREGLLTQIQAQYPATRFITEMCLNGHCLLKVG